MATEAPLTERANALIPAVGAVSHCGIAVDFQGRVVVPGWPPPCLWFAAVVRRRATRCKWEPRPMAATGSVIPRGKHPPEAGLDGGTNAMRFLSTVLVASLVFHCGYLSLSNVRTQQPGRGTNWLVLGRRQRGGSIQCQMLWAHRGRSPAPCEAFLTFWHCFWRRTNRRGMASRRVRTSRVNGKRVRSGRLGGCYIV